MNELLKHRSVAECLRRGPVAGCEMRDQPGQFVIGSFAAPDNTLSPLPLCLPVIVRAARNTAWWPHQVGDLRSVPIAESIVI
jgi:hypothetical protein